MANKRRAGKSKRSEQLPLRLTLAERARFDYLADLRKEVLGVPEESAGGLAAFLLMRQVQRDVLELESIRAKRQQEQLAEPALQVAGAGA